jgi:hypothetical protein
MQDRALEGLMKPTLHALATDRSIESTTGIERASRMAAWSPYFAFGGLPQAASVDGGLEKARFSHADFESLLTTVGAKFVYIFRYGPA